VWRAEVGRARYISGFRFATEAGSADQRQSSRHTPCAVFVARAWEAERHTECAYYFG
jgi:hypothetical protein